MAVWAGKAAILTDGAQHSHRLVVKVEDGVRGLNLRGRGCPFSGWNLVAGMSLGSWPGGLVLLESRRWLWATLGTGQPLGVQLSSWAEASSCLVRPGVRLGPGPREQGLKWPHRFPAQQARGPESSGVVMVAAVLPWGDGGTGILGWQWVKGWHPMCPPVASPPHTRPWGWNFPYRLVCLHWK